ncbi:MAG: GTP cyclohydrolase II [Pseudomonadota bacterium]|nr:GTP cyclohydrolase II [Pseudomonadota bacterium]
MDRSHVADPGTAGARDAAGVTGNRHGLDSARHRVVYRAAAELRRGLPVLLTGGTPLVILPAETAGRRGLREMVELGGEPPTLLLTPVRAASVLHRPVQRDGSVVALTLGSALCTPEHLQALADPTLDQARPEQPEVVSPPPAAPAALALLKLARLLPAAVAVAPGPQAAETAARLGLLSVAADEVIGGSHSGAGEGALTRLAEARVPLEDAAETRIIAFRADDAGIEHLAIVVGDPHAVEAPLVRLHSECFTGDLLGSLRCDCGLQLRAAIRRMAQEQAGVLLYLAQEGRGIGLVNKLRAYKLQDRGLDTIDANRALGWGADERNFQIAATMLDALGIRRIRLLTNNPDKLAALAACGIAIAGRVPHAFKPNGVNDHYLATKARRFGHLLD